MQNWDDLRFCLALDRFQTMTAAAKALGTNTATVSRRIERLTDQAGQPLFLRENSNWVATDFGRELASIAERIEEKIQTAEISQSVTYQLRSLRLSAPDAILQAQMVHSVQDLFALHPNLDLTLSSENASLAFGETDLVLSHIEPSEGRIIRRKLGQMSYAAYYGQRYERAPSGWISVDALANAGISQNCLAKFFEAPSKQKIGELNLAALLAQTTPFVCLLPMQMGDSIDALARFDEIPVIRANIWMSYHYTRKNDPAIKAAVEWAERAFASIRQTATIN